MTLRGLGGGGGDPIWPYPCPDNVDDWSNNKGGLMEIEGGCGGRGSSLWELDIEEGIRGDTGVTRLHKWTLRWECTPFLLGHHVCLQQRGTRSPLREPLTHRLIYNEESPPCPSSNLPMAPLHPSPYQSENYLFHPRKNPHNFASKKVLW